MVKIIRIKIDIEIVNSGGNSIENLISSLCENCVCYSLNSRNCPDCLLGDSWQHVPQ